MEQTVYQDNVNEQWRLLNDDLLFDVQIKPLIYYHFYDDVKFLEFGNKILVPKRILFELSKYDNVKYPINIRIDNTQYILGVHEFREDIDMVYIPKTVYLNLGLDEDINIINKLTVLYNEIPKGESIILKPYENNVSSIPDIAKYLTHNLKTFHSCLHVGDTIKTPYGKDNLKFEIVECVPDNIISIIDVDLDVIIETSYEYDKHLKMVEEAKRESERLAEEAKAKAEEEAASAPADPQQFVSFSGKGRRLCD